MLRGVAYVGGGACRIHVDADSAELVMAFGGDEGEPPTVVRALAAVPPDVRLQLHQATGDYFYVGKRLRSRDTRGPEL